MLDNVVNKIELRFYFITNTLNIVTTHMLSSILLSV